MSSAVNPTGSCTHPSSDGLGSPGDRLWWCRGCDRIIVHEVIPIPQGTPPARLQRTRLANGLGGERIVIHKVDAVPQESRTRLATYEDIRDAIAEAWMLPPPTMHSAFGVESGPPLMWQLCLDCGHHYTVHTDLGLDHGNWGLAGCEVAHCDCERFSQEMANFS